MLKALEKCTLLKSSLYLSCIDHAYDMSSPKYGLAGSGQADRHFRRQGPGAL